MVVPVAAGLLLVVAGAELLGPAAPQAASMAAPARVRTIRCIERTSAVADGVSTAPRYVAPAALFSTHVPKHQDAPWCGTPCGRRRRSRGRAAIRAQDQRLPGTIKGEPAGLRGGRAGGNRRNHATARRSAAARLKRRPPNSG